MSSDLWIITSYFNPLGYQTRRDNYRHFIAAMNAVGANVAVVELALDDDPFELPEGPRTLRVRGRDPMWHQFRLLNLARALLPASCTKVAWVDCDVLFEDPAWMQRASETLEQYPVIQPYSLVAHLPPQRTQYTDEAQTYSFASVWQREPRFAGRGESKLRGHTGFAWAARRDVFEEIGLYDGCIVGTADCLMAHGMGGDWKSEQIENLIGLEGAHNAHFTRWAERAYRCVGGRFGCTPGRILHLWHGDYDARRYTLRNAQFKQFDFDPQTDIRANADGVWEWASPKPAMHEWMRDFFVARNEDGGLTGPVLERVHERLTPARRPTR